MERRGSGMKKILGEYKRFENLEHYHAPEFNSNASEFHVTLWNLNYGIDVIKESPNVIKAPEDVSVSAMLGECKINCVRL